MSVDKYSERLKGSNVTCKSNKVSDFDQHGGLHQDPYLAVFKLKSSFQLNIMEGILAHAS